MVSCKTDGKFISPDYFNFTAGFAFLPFMWAVNGLWFLKEAFFKPPYQEQKQIKRCEFQFIPVKMFPAMKLKVFFSVDIYFLSDAFESLIIYIYISSISIL